MNISICPTIRLFLAVGIAVPLPGLAEDEDASSQQRITAEAAMQQIVETRQGDVGVAEYLKELSTAFSRESRNDGWAKMKEADLRKSYASLQDLPRDALKGIECRSSTCELRLQTPAGRTPEETMDQQYAIDEWVAWSQPCAYTMVTDLATDSRPGEVRIYLQCNEGK